LVPSSPSLASGLEGLKTTLAAVKPRTIWQDI